MNYSFNELFDPSKIKELLFGFFQLTGIPSAILDLKGNCVLAAGWKRMCIHYQSEDPDAIHPCYQCDLGMSSLEDKAHVIKKCACGIMRAGAPIRVQGVQVAILMVGQFFVDTLEPELFEMRAQKQAVSEDDYLKILAEIPIYTRQKIEAILNHFQKVAEMLGEIELNRLELLEKHFNELLREKQRLKIIFDRITNVGIQIYNQEGKILYWNPASEEFFGWSSAEAVGKTLEQLMFDPESHQEFLESFNKLTQGIQVKPREWVCKDKQGKERIVFSTIVPLFEMGRYEFICMDIDLSEHRKFEKELARLESLNLVGEMAASISHEIRNPLTTVRGFLQFLSEKIESQNYQEYFQLMIQELDRANSIITEFLSLAKNRPIRLEEHDLNQIIRALSPLIEANAIVSNQTFTIQTEDLPLLKVDEKEIRQLILNLIRNAIEAMKDEGHLLLKTAHSEDEVILSIQDTGPGIEPTVLEKMGTPFISTKENGTGLGLAVCYSIALRHNAVIQAESTPSGTTFMVRFKIA